MDEMVKGQDAKNGAPELLAPAGHVESFMAALENGADAIYLGLKSLSARASATNFSLDDLSFLIPYAHKRQVSIYIALNSLVTAPEFSKIIHLLQSLSDLSVDALIIQDPGVLFLVRRFFPHMKLHASTLTAIHNQAGVNQLEKMGFERIVLARELTFQEIEQIAAGTKAEIEIFVHGALCFSYSGLCLASSFRGGHSGLQGKCVQPCRLRMRQGKKEGFFLSCNDFCSLPFMPRLRQLRLAAVKIEGRMKSADYIARVVKAYRLVMDAPPGTEEEAVRKAQEWLAQAPSRHLTSGWLGDDSNMGILTPHRSGSSGLWVGTVKSVQGSRAQVVLRHELRPGDRLRPESKGGKEKVALTVSEIFSPEGRSVILGRAGDRVALTQRGDLLPGERLFKVGAKMDSQSGIWNRIRKDCGRAVSFSKSFPNASRMWKDWPALPSHRLRTEETLILKIGEVQDLHRAFQSPARWVILAGTRSNLERLARQRLIPAQKKRFAWSLPPLLAERETGYYRAAVKWYLESGFASWEINNWAHLEFFEKGNKANLISGNRFNVRNVGALAALFEAGCRWSVLSLEITREEIQQLSSGPFSTIPIISVYAWPPLFISRLTPKLKEETPVFTMRKEALLFRRKHGYSRIYADRPMNWCDQLPFLRDQGFSHFLLDFSDGPHETMNDLDRVLEGYKHSKSAGIFSRFNWDRKP